MGFLRGEFVGCGFWLVWGWYNTDSYVLDVWWLVDLVSVFLVLGLLLL